MAKPGAMPEAARTLVKSPPELWAEVSDPDALARHLGAFGDIRITRLMPETTVAWEGDRACGTVDLKPAGWGTKVRVVAEVAEEEEVAVGEDAAPEPEPESEPAPSAAAGAPAASEAPGAAGPEAAGPVAPGPAPAPDQAEAGPRGVRAFFARLLGRRRRGAASEPWPPAAGPRDEPEAAAEAPSEPRPEDQPAAEAPSEPQAEPTVAPTPPPEPVVTRIDPDAVLDGMLDALGAAHHRPFSRG